MNGTRAWVVGVVVGLFASCAGAQERKPNVLFIAVDDLNAWVGCVGKNPQVKTPNIDRLAAKGVLFTRAYCAAPACNPSRAALMSGIRPSTSGVYENGQPWRPAMPDAVTLQQHFMRNGYEAVNFGKIYHERFDEPRSWDEHIKAGGQAPPGEKAKLDARSRSGGIVWGATDLPEGEMPDARTVDRAAAYLKAEHDEPFFLAVGIAKPHMPWSVPQSYYDQYPLDGIKLPEVMEDDLKDVPAAGVKIARPGGDHAKMLDTGNWKRAVQAYLASITFADAQVGRLIEALEKSAYKDDTIVVLWGDHGWHLGEKRHWRKFALWEEATRTPLIFVVPGVTKAGSVCDKPVDFMNLYPTLTDLCALPGGKNQEGVSMRPLLADPKAQWDRPALMTHGKGNHAVRSERWRYIRYADGSEELYDHSTDELEWKNLAAEARHADVKAELAKWMPKIDAPDAKRRGGSAGE